MAQKRSYEFLPEVFQTETNKKLLAATLDQLVSEPVFKKTQGFVGRRLGAGIDATGSYVVETSKQRQDYQLEPGVVFLKTNTQTAVDAITYPGLLDTVTNRGGDSTHADQLFASESYSWDPLLDLDKFVNFSQYYWLPGGPNPVDVVATEIAITGDFTVTRESVDYKVSAFAGANPVVTLVRGGSYTFTVNQDSEFWIQSAPGIEGVLPITPNISSRDVYGVVNNGAKSGKIKFNVPFVVKHFLAFSFTEFFVSFIDVLFLFFLHDARRPMPRYNICSAPRGFCPTVNSKTVTVSTFCARPRADTSEQPIKI